MIAEQHRLLPRFRAGADRHLRNREHARIAAEIVKEEGQPLKAGKPTATAGGDPWQMRMIPVIGPGVVGGAIPGTRPDKAIEKLDEKGGWRGEM